MRKQKIRRNRGEYDRPRGAWVRNLKTVFATVAIAAASCTASAAVDANIAAYQDVPLYGSYLTVTLQGAATVKGGNTLSCNKLRVSSSEAVGWGDGGARFQLNGRSQADIGTVEVSSGYGSDPRILYVFCDSNPNKLNVGTLLVSRSGRDSVKLSGTVAMTLGGGTVAGNFDVKKDTSGAAEVLLSGELKTSGAINVAGGVFTDQGSITGAGSVDVKSQGIFCGTGTVQNLTVESQGILRAGDDKGWMTVTGNLILREGGVLEIPVSGISNGGLNFVASQSHSYTAGGDVVLRVVGSTDQPSGKMKIMDWSRTVVSEDSLFDPSNYVLQIDADGIAFPRLSVEGQAMYLVWGGSLPPGFRGLKTRAPFLHEVWYEADYVSAVDAACPDTPDTVPAFGCSGVRNGNFLGRNFDYFLDDVPTFVVHMAAKDDPDPANRRLASVGVCQQWGMREDGVTNGQYTASYARVPEMMLDGVNECGVVIEDNVVSAGDCGELTGTNPDAAPLNIMYVPRFVLDHATNAEHAVELIRSRNIVGDIHGEYYLHYLIADKDKTFVVEVITNTVVARDMKIMTNFNLNWDNGNQCAVTDASEGWSAADYESPWIADCTLEAIASRYSPHAQGIERFITLRDHYDEGGTFEGMFNLMRHVQYTKEVDPDTTPLWVTELCSSAEGATMPCGNTNVSCTVTGLYGAFKNDYDNFTNSVSGLMGRIREVLANKEANRKLNTGVWQTVHNSTYDITNRMFRIAVQENYDTTFDFYLVSPSGEGSEESPWKVGPMGREESVLAYTNGAGVLVIEGAGKVEVAPWADVADDIRELEKEKGVTELGEIVATLPKLEYVNGLSQQEFTAAALGVISAAGFDGIEVVGGKALLDVSVYTSDTLTNEVWSCATNGVIEVPASAPSGYYILKSKGAK